jgi:hypothetical protein
MLRCHIPPHLRGHYRLHVKLYLLSVVFRMEFQKLDRLIHDCAYSFQPSCDYLGLVLAEKALADLIVCPGSGTKCKRD